MTGRRTRQSSWKSGDSSASVASRSAAAICAASISAGVKDATNTERNPDSTARPACVTSPLNSTAVPTGGRNTIVGGFTDARERPGPRSSHDQNAVPPPTKFSCGESRISTVRLCLSSAYKRPTNRMREGRGAVRSRRTKCKCGARESLLATRFWSRRSAAGWEAHRAGGTRHPRCRGCARGFDQTRLKLPKQL